METYTQAKPLIRNPTFDSDRLKALEGLRSELLKGSIDEPVSDIVERIACLPFCYTIQSCYGHFMVGRSTEDRNTKRVADFGGTATKLHYRIAYVAFCIEDSVEGRTLLEELKAVSDIDPDYIQSGSADWFWGMSANTYVLQVSPLRNAYEDSFDVSIEEALRIEQTRDRFFNKLREVLSRNQSRDGCGPGEI